MPNILLLGAGFSRNWGGLLASEVFEHLLAIPEIHSDLYLRQLLWKTSTRGGFEDALDEAQRNAMSDVEKVQSLQALRAGISSVFENMNKGFFDLVAIEPGVRDSFSSSMRYTA